MSEGDWSTSIIRAIQAACEKGVNVKHVLGFQNHAAVFYEDKFKSFGSTYVTTVDGSHGTKGFVTDVMNELSFDTIYSCGPTAMLKAVEAGYATHKKCMYP